MIITILPVSHREKSPKIAVPFGPSHRIQPEALSHSWVRLLSLEGSPILHMAGAGYFLGGFDTRWCPQF